MPTGTSGNDTWNIAHVSEINTYNGLDGADTLVFGAAARSLFSITQNTDGSISVDSVSSASNSAVYKLKLTSIEVLQFARGTDVVDLVAMFGTPAINPIAGTSANDNLAGTTRADSITGESGNDRINGKGGSDTINGGAGVDTIVLDGPLSSLLGYTYAGGLLTLTTSTGTTELREFERVKFADAYFAFDTLTGSAPWQAAALYRAWFGVMPDRAQLSQWTSAADSSSSMGALATQMLGSFAPGVSNADVVGKLYQSLTGRVAPASDLAAFSAQIGSGKTYATQGDLFAWAASLANNTVQLTGFAGSIQSLDGNLFP